MWIISPGRLLPQGAFSQTITIPSGTSAISFSFTGIAAGTVNTVNFSAVSIVIDDVLSPRLEANATPELSGGATVAVTVSESGSGLQGVYYAAGTVDASAFPAAGTAVTITDGAGSFFVSTGGPYTICAEDNRGNTDLKTIDVNTYPSISGLADQSISEDAQLAFAFDVSDAETLEE